MSPSTLHPPIHQGLPHPRSSTLNKRILKREKRNCLSDTWHRSQTRTHEDCFFFTAWFWSEEGCDLTEGGLSGHWLPPPLYFCPRHRGAAQEVGHKNLRLTRDCLCLLELLLWVLINEWWMIRKTAANVCLTIDHTGPKIHKKVNSRISQKVPPDKARNQTLQIFVASRQQLSPCTSCRHLPAQLLIATCFHVTRKMENGPRKVYA